MSEITVTLLSAVSDPSIIPSWPAPLSFPTPLSLFLSLLPSGQQKLLHLPEGLLSNTRLPRHSGLMCVWMCCVCMSASPELSADRPSMPLHHWDLTVLLPFCLLGKHPLGWKGPYSAGGCLCVCACTRMCDCVRTGNPRELEASQKEKVLKTVLASGFVTVREFNGLKISADNNEVRIEIALNL